MQQTVTFIRIALVLAFVISVSTIGNAADQVRVYLLVGQSNMEGKGNPAHLDTYKDDPAIQADYPGLKDGTEWRVRKDVWIAYPSKHQGAKYGPLTVGYGTKEEHSIGPEFGFGHAIGNSCDEPVLLIKIAWGGKSLQVDFRPPGLPPNSEEVGELLAQARKRNPETKEAEVRERFGHYYREMVRLAREELASYETRFPELKGKSAKFCGFVWHQGFNDMINHELREQAYQPYTDLLVQFIKDVRSDFNTPDLPFVIGELGTGGIPERGDFQRAQKNAADAFGKEGHVVFVPTAEYYDTVAQDLFEKNYWKGTDEQKAMWEKVGNDRPYHYLGSGKTYYLKGRAFAQALLDMERVE